jgi:hypothetical protein
MIGSTHYERAAISWHTRFCGYAPDLTFSDAQAVMAALAALPSSEQPTAASQLAELSRRYSLDDVADTVERWLASRASTPATWQRPSASRAARPFTARGHHPTAA